MAHLIDSAPSIQAVSQMLKNQPIEPEAVLKLSSLGLKIKKERSELANATTELLSQSPTGTVTSTCEDSCSASESSMPSTPTRIGFSELLDPTVIRLDDACWQQIASVTSENETHANSSTSLGGYWPTMSVNVSEAMEVLVGCSPLLSAAHTATNSTMTTAAEIVNSGLTVSAGNIAASTNNNDMSLFMNFGTSVDLTRYPRSIMPAVNNGFTAADNISTAPFIDPKEVIPCPLIPPQHSYLLPDNTREADIERTADDLNRNLNIADRSPRLVSAFSAYYESGHFTELPPPGTPVLRELSDHSGFPVFDAASSGLVAASDILGNQQIPMEFCFDSASAFQAVQPPQDQDVLFHRLQNSHSYQEMLVQQLPSSDLNVQSLRASHCLIDESQSQQQMQHSNIMFVNLNDITSPEQQVAAAKNAQLNKRAVHSTTASGRIGKRMLRGDDKKREWICPQCHRAFMRSEHLKRHVSSVHTDSKPFTCQEPGCGKMFARSDNLQQHHRTHQRKTTRLSKKQRATAANTAASAAAMSAVMAPLPLSPSPLNHFSQGVLFLTGN